VSDDKLRIWNQVDKTNPANTKEVTYGRKFTAIDAYSQIKKATEIFGPVGSGWGYGVELGDVEGVCVARITLWYESRENTIIAYGTNKWTNKNGVDEDSPKKAVTDGITKALSYLGFNADVFMGKFDDNKYIAAMNTEFNGENNADGGGNDKNKQKNNGNKPPANQNSGEQSGKQKFFGAYQARCKACDVQVPADATINNMVLTELSGTALAGKIAFDNEWDMPTNNMNAKSNGWQVLEQVIANYDLKGAVLRATTDQSKGAA